MTDNNDKIPEKPMTREEAEKVKADMLEGVATLLGRTDVDTQKVISLVQPIAVQTVECKELIVKQLTLGQKIALNKAGIKLESNDDDYTIWPETKPDKFIKLMAACTYSSEKPDVQLSETELSSLCTYDAKKLAYAFFSLIVQ
jgi:hypothetical protein